MLTLAGVGQFTFAYRLVFLLHITCVIVGFGSTFVYPILGAEARKRRGVEAKALSDASLIAAKRVTTPVIYAAIFSGIVLVAISSAWKFSDGWVSAAMVLAVIAVAFSAGVHVPNLKRMNGLVNELAAMGPPPAGAAPSGPPPQVAELEKRGRDAARNGGILHLIFLLFVIDMIWKPFM